ncbi:MAG: PKD domain-containing protein [Flavobacteriales bacterium]|nr:PKD domain-containing protein [Flavobacteriales bacterium]
MNQALSQIVMRIMYTGLSICIYANGLFAQQPIGAFTSNLTSGCSPITVNFIDLSTNSPTAWSWDFGNGNSATSQNPSAVYTDTGTYTVTLVVTNANGSDSVAKVNYITVLESPVPNFTSNITNGCSLTVQFADSSSPGSSLITSWFWDFGDGSSSTTQNPAHTYSTAGSYYVGLTVNNSEGCSNTLLINGYAAVSEGPQVGFTSITQTGCSIPLTVNFSDSSVQGSSTITEWAWDFGDSTLGSVQNPTHTFTSFGSLDITLTVTDLDNCSDSLILIDYIIIDDFQADFSSDTIVICPDLQVNFADSSSPNPASWLWDFGNGASDTVQNPVYVYDTTGVYTVSLITINALGCTDTIVKSNYIDFEQPVASFIADSMDNCELPFPVNFTNNSTGIGPLSYDWDFDDGGPVDTNANPSHTYNDTGIFKVSLIVKDAFGCTDTLSMAELTDSIVIWRPNANYFSSPLSGCIPLPVNFLNFSGSWVGAITNYDWNFGDSLSGVNNTSTLTTPTHTYDSVGDYTITLIVTTDRGCKDTTTAVNFIKSGELPDTVYFAKAQDTACHGAPVQFTDLSVDTVNNWWWSFDDGQGTTLQNPNHAFQDTGWLMITLVADFNGCKDTSLADSIYILPPKASFGTDHFIMCSVPDTISFWDYSWEAESWLWDFGDGSPQDTTKNPTHIYSDPNTAFFPVTLVAYHSNGCIDTVTTDMANPNIKTGFSADDTTGCFTMDVSFTDTSTANMTIVNWYWTFGDGDTSGSAIPSPHTYSDTGQYDITLVTTSFQCTDTLTKKAFITVNGVFPELVSDTLTGCLPLMVNLTDSSTGTSPVLSWSWDFGDGSALDTVQNPTHTYNDTGFYDVKLIVVDSNGCTDTIMKDNYIRPTFPYPEFNFSVNTCIGENINITNTAVGIGLNYFWDFGDGSTDSVLNPAHSYLDTGNFTIMLIATDTNGCDSTVSQVISVRPFPVADFSVDAFITNCPPLVVTFSDLSTAIGDSIIGWFWDFGDSGTATAQNPVHTFSYPDTFDVTLVITNSTGCSDTIVYSSLIFVGGPSGTFAYSPDSGCAPLAVTFNASAANTVNYQWDYGDGIIDTLITDSTVHQYSQPANPTPSLLLIDSAGCVQLATAPSPGSIIIDQPVASMLPNYSVVCGFDTVVFLDYSYTLNPNTAVISRLWDFGDGDTSILVNPTHFYADSGIYVVTLTIGTSIGCTISTSDTIHVTVNDSSDILIGLFIDTFNVICFGANDGTAMISVTGGSQSYTYQWNDSLNQTTDTASGLLPGTYTVNVTDLNGCKITDSTTIEEVPLMIISISNTVNSTCKSDNNGEATVSVTGGMPPYTYLWDDDSAQTDASAVNLAGGTYNVMVTDTIGCDTSISVTIALDSILTLVFSAPDTVCAGANSMISVTVTGGDGNYAYLWSEGSTSDTVTINIDTTTTYVLTVSDSCAQQEKDSVTVAVYPYAPIGISPLFDSGCGEVTVLLSDTVSKPPGSFYFWDFGDGNTSNAAAPNHTFANAGTYNVVLTVTFQSGCTLSSSGGNYITVYPLPAVTCSADPMITDIRDPDISFNSNSSASSYSWDFGDNDASQAEDTVHYYPDTGTYNVILTVTDTNSCENTCAFTILITPYYELEIPNGFTPQPNGPSGGQYDPTALNNDIFYPFTDYVEQFHMMIFNRWGEMVFESTDIKIGWDGYYRGNLSQQDVYTWKIKIKYVDGHVIEQIGDLTLIR